MVATADSILLGKDVTKMTLEHDKNDFIETSVDDTVGKGTVILTGGNKGLSDVDRNSNNGEDTANSTKTSTKGSYYQHPVSDTLHDDMRIASNEVFGPLMSFLTWDSEYALINAVN